MADVRVPLQYSPAGSPWVENPRAYDIILYTLRYCNLILGYISTQHTFARMRPATSYTAVYYIMQCCSL